MEAPPVERRLVAILSADVEGYSRLMDRDEVGTLGTLTAYRVIIDRLIASHRGRIFNTAGDSLVAISPALWTPCNVPSRCRMP